jgi:hypothetical protein
VEISSFEIRQRLGRNGQNSRFGRPSGKASYHRKNGAKRLRLGVGASSFPQAALTQLPMTVMIGQSSWVNMHASVSKLMVALVLAQAVSGWCCHRPCHCLDGEIAEASQDAKEVGSHECCHDDHLVLNASSHCQCHECQGFCTYVAGAKLQIVRPHTATGLDVAAMTADAAQTQRAVAQWSQISAASVHPGPPVRLHLLHQSLLI